MRLTLSALALGASLLSSCSSPSTSSQPAPPPAESPATPVASAMVASDRCDAVRDLMVDTVVHQALVGYLPGYYDGRAYPMAAPVAAPVATLEDGAARPADPAASAGSAAGGGGPSHYTTTNVQEQHVDEGDLVKTDGKYVYTLRNGELLIAKTWPVAETALLSRVQFKNLQARELYLDRDKLVVHGVALDASLPSGATRVAVIDIRDRAAPKLVRTFDVDGQNASSRVIGGDLYLVQTGALAVPPRLYELAQQTIAQLPRAERQSLRPWEIQARLAKTLRQTLLDSLSTDDIASALPKISTGGATSRMKCRDLYVPQDNTQLGLTALARITLDNQRNDLVGAMVSGGQVYASTEAVYVAAPAYTWNPQGSASYQTQIHQFALTRNDGRPTYVATGAVDGQLLNQFSMSEHDGDLRVATTDWNWQVFPLGTATTTSFARAGHATARRLPSGANAMAGMQVTSFSTQPRSERTARPRIVAMSISWSPSRFDETARTSAVGETAMPVRFVPSPIIRRAPGGGVSAGTSAWATETRRRSAASRIPRTLLRRSMRSCEIFAPI